jgi:hypothetical protein
MCQNRYDVIISNCRVDNGKFFVTLNLKDWNEHFCFYYLAEKIDSKSFYAHVLWKFSSDPNYVIIGRVDADISQSDAAFLNLHNWGFHEA